MINGKLLNINQNAAIKDGSLLDGLMGNSQYID